MRKSYETQSFLFEPTIPEIEIPETSRHALYAAIRSLQWIFPKRKQICELITSDLCRGKSPGMGAKGLSGWQVLVFCSIRMIHEKTFDELELFSNEMTIVRQLLELSNSNKIRFSSKTLQENLNKVTPETIQEINTLFQGWIVEAGYEDGKNVRADSFVCKRPIHYPTDQSILFDAVRSMAGLCINIFGNNYGWRQSKHLIKKSKRLSREVSQSKRGGGKGKEHRVKSAYRRQINEAKIILQKVFASLQLFESDKGNLTDKQANNFSWACINLGQCIEQAERRALKGEKIESSNKILSIYEKETEWINRGKFPIAYEFGHRVFLAEGKSGMILDYSVGPKKTDLSELVPMLKRLKQQYGHLEMISLDKGYWRKGVRDELLEYVNRPVIAKKGKLSDKEREIQKEDKFKKDRQWRSGVESLISSCVRANGMGRCRDKGITAYRRWVGLGVFARNLITFGRILQEEEIKKAG
jgi:hypothetical protein